MPSSISAVNSLFILLHMTWSSPRFPLCSHSMVHSKNNSYFVGIKPLLEQDLIKLFYNDIYLVHVI